MTNKGDCVFWTSRVWWRRASQSLCVRFQYRFVPISGSGARRGRFCFGATDNHHLETRPLGLFFLIPMCPNSSKHALWYPFKYAPAIIGRHIPYRLTPDVVTLLPPHPRCLPSQHPHQCLLNRKSPVSVES